MCTCMYKYVHSITKIHYLVLLKILCRIPLCRHVVKA